MDNRIHGLCIKTVLIIYLMFTSQDLAPELENEKGTAGALGSGGGGTGSGNGGESVATTTIKGRRVKDHRYTQQVGV